MRKYFIAAIVSLFAGLTLLAPTAPALAATPAPDFASCKNLAGWYVNDDETADRPAATATGLLFTGKDLIHHATSPIDLADMDKVTASHSSTNSGKVVFKVETSAPYSTIVTQADGKLWSTAMTYDQQGGQGHPVGRYSDLVGLDTKPGKAKFDGASKVVTFGVGYWTEDGESTVTAIDFHGKHYDLSCPPKPTVKPKPSASSSRTPGAGVHTIPNPPQNGPALAVTGPDGRVLAGGAVVLALLGGALLVISRRRKTHFRA